VEFGGYFADIFTEIPPMIALHAELRQSGMSTYIFSNTNDLASSTSSETSLFQEFRRLHLLLRSRRDEARCEIYEAMEKLCGRSGADIIYLDDRPENVQAGLARGWKAILHETRKDACSFGKIQISVGADVRRLMLTQSGPEVSLVTSVPANYYFQAA